MNGSIQLFAAYRARHDEFFPDTGEPIDYFATASERIRKTAAFEETNEAKALNDYLLGLSLEQIKELQVMMYIGRGDYEARDWLQACDDIPMTDNKDVEIEQLLEKTPLADYLMDGFEMLNSKRIV